MTPKIDDRALWIGLGVFLFFAAKGVRIGLRKVVQLTEVHNPPLEEPALIPKRGKEDAIKTGSLEILATCDNVEIAKSATRIFCQRFVNNSHAVTRLSADLESSDPNTKEPARRATRLLVQAQAVPDLHGRPGPHSSTRGEADWESNVHNFLRENDDTADQDLRRRRREAVIVNEGDRPISQDDIIVRGRNVRLNDRDAREAEAALEGISRRERDERNPESS